MRSPAGQRRSRAGRGLPALWHHRSKGRAAINLDTLPRVRLAHLPTPLEPLERLSAALAGQDVRRRIARAFVCTAGGADGVPGFNTLSALSMAFGPQPVPARYRVEERAGRM